MTNGQVQMMFSALRQLAGRKLPSMGADLKVARLIESMRPTAVAIDSALRKRTLEKYKDLTGVDLNQEQPEGEAQLMLTPQQESLLKMAIEAEQADVIGAEVAPPIELPAARIVAADLPKDLVGKEGWQNAVGLAGIVADLGPLFKHEDEG